MEAAQANGGRGRKAAGVGIIATRCSTQDVCRATSKEPRDKSLGQSIRQGWVEPYLAFKVRVEGSLRRSHPKSPPAMMAEAGVSLAPWWGSEAPPPMGQTSAEWRMRYGA